jgi:hypothetical protein
VVNKHNIRHVWVACALAAPCLQSEECSPTQLRRDMSVAQPALEIAGDCSEQTSTSRLQDIHSIRWRSNSSTEQRLVAVHTSNDCILPGGLTSTLQAQSTHTVATKRRDTPSNAAYQYASSCRRPHATNTRSVPAARQSDVASLPRACDSGVLTRRPVVAIPEWTA